jgi:hypothetical protein
VNNRTVFHSGGSKPNCAAPIFNQRDSALLWRVGWWRVEGDAEPDLDVPAGDADVFDE